MRAKDLLLHELDSVLRDDPEMSLRVSIEGLTAAEAGARVGEGARTIEEVLYHLADSTIWYLGQAFGWRAAHERGDLAATLALVDTAYDGLRQALADLPDDRVDQPLPTRFHGESAAHFFWIMILHVASHAAQIRTMRRCIRS